jgi:hypothetical protein
MEDEMQKTQGIGHHQGSKLRSQMTPNLLLLPTRHQRRANVAAIVARRRTTR